MLYFELYETIVTVIFYTLNRRVNHLLKSFYTDCLFLHFLTINYEVILTVDFRMLVCVCMYVLYINVKFECILVCYMVWKCKLCMPEFVKCPMNL